MYQREVEVPRLVARLPADGPLPDALARLRAWLEDRYQRALPAISANWYRDGHDSVAWHGDRGAADPSDTLVAVLTLGAERPFLLRPRGGGAPLRLLPGSGEVLVMGGSCQARYEHAVPKVPYSAGRISVQFREVEDPGEASDLRPPTSPPRAPARP
jgi:alkylated DNA repair dioxygenase AlkB